MRGRRNGNESMEREMTALLHIRTQLFYIIDNRYL